jgi:hypothetical protein
MAEKIYGPKWYARSGDVRLVVAGCTAEDAAAILAMRAFETDRVIDMGQFIHCSEQGFKSIATDSFWSPTVLLKMCQIPVTWSVLNLDRE